MSQTQMISLRGKAKALKSRDEMIRDILIALMIALAVSLILCYLPMILDATQKASTSNDGWNCNTSCNGNARSMCCTSLWISRIKIRSNVARLANANHYCILCDCTCAYDLSLVRDNANKKRIIHMESKITIILNICRGHSRMRVAFFRRKLWELYLTHLSNG